MSYRVALCGMFTSLIITIKYALGFFPGIELTTMMVTITALFLPKKEALLTIMSSILLIGVLYGMGTWWIMYWPIFMSNAFLTICFKKYIVNNPLLLGVWTFLFSFSIMVWYFWFDNIVFGNAYAISNISTAVIPNLLGAVINFVVSIIILEPTHITISKLEKRYNFQKW